MTKILQDVGLNPIVPDGGYFMIADMTPLTKFIDEKELDSTNDPWDYKGKFFIYNYSIKMILFLSRALVM